MSEKIAVWNTGAHYSENGQRIAAIIVDGVTIKADFTPASAYASSRAALAKRGTR